MSADPTDLLAEAQTVVGVQLTRLRALVEVAQQRATRASSDLRQAERAYDEVSMQHRFAVSQKLPTAGTLARREQSLRAAFETQREAHQQAQRSLKQLDQLVRQIDMSSATLSGSGEGDKVDPWAQALRSQVIKGREEERVRLAREVHDGPAQVLANSLMLLEHLRTAVDDEQRRDKVPLMVERMLGMARDGLSEVRRFITDLRPGNLDEQGLVGALHTYVRRYQDTYNMKVVLEADTLPRLPTESEIVLYRIVQEALQNAYKHARTATVRIVLTARQGVVTLHIRDDGLF
ncbi:MAG: histidine kinase [Chloroflexaceae bacterium]|nr:histidine kinase [Chloroflexaceae bacterium]